jgi:syntaxin-binding protein 5
MSFLECNGALIPYSYEAWKDENKEGRERISKDAVAQSTVEPWFTN